MDAVGAFVISGMGTRDAAEVTSGDRRILYVLQENGPVLKGFDVSSEEQCSELHDLGPGIGNLRAIESLADPRFSLWEGFGNGDGADWADATNPYAGRWKVVDEVNSSGWHVAGGYLAENTNSGGTYVYYDGGMSWTDYELTADLYCGDNDGIGLIFRYTGPGDYYKLVLNRQANTRKLIRVQGEAATELWSVAGGYTQSTWFELKNRGNLGRKRGQDTRLPQRARTLQRSG